jgi:hypothetical protein
MEQSKAVGRAEFAEEAEALGVPTDQIASRRPIEDDPGRVGVNFTPERGGEMWWAILERDLAGILRELAREAHPEGNDE